MSGTKNKVTDLKNQLMAQIERLSDLDLTEEKDQAQLKLELERSKQIANVATAVTNMAKVEVEYLELLTRHGGENKSNFFDDVQTKFIGR